VELYVRFPVCLHGVNGDFTFPLLVKNAMEFLVMKVCVRACVRVCMPRPLIYNVVCQPPTVTVSSVSY
jgi:hypothetical protein